MSHKNIFTMHLTEKDRAIVLVNDLIMYFLTHKIAYFPLTECHRHLKKKKSLIKLCWRIHSHNAVHTIRYTLLSTMLMNNQDVQTMMVANIAFNIFVWNQTLPMMKEIFFVESMGDGIQEQVCIRGIQSNQLKQRRNYVAYPSIELWYPTGERTLKKGQFDPHVYHHTMYSKILVDKRYNMCSKIWNTCNQFGLAPLVLPASSQWIRRNTEPFPLTFDNIAFRKHYCPTDRRHILGENIFCKLTDTYSLC